MLFWEVINSLMLDLLSNDIHVLLASNTTCETVTPNQQATEKLWQENKSEEQENGYLVQKINDFLWLATKSSQSML